MRQGHLNPILYCRKFTSQSLRSSLPPRGVFLDWDGTVIKFNERRFVNSFNQTLMALNYPESMHLATLYGSQSIISSFKDRLKSPEEAQAAYNKFKEIFVSQPICAKDLMPGARGFIAQIKAAGIPLGVISNLDQALLERQVEMIKLTNSFNVITGSAQKPEHSSLVSAAHSLHLPSSKAIWFIGDSLHTDILAANRAGFTSILVSQSGPLLDSGLIKADIELNSLHEARQIFNIVTQRGKSI